jgi:glycosyltransferase involved in cell wall biosynthesis
MHLPPVSIIIGNYNYARFVGAAIDSALAVDYPDVEVVVVDDGSTDGSDTVIRGYGERIVAIFKPNGGQAAAFNLGFARSRGDIVFFLDSDDLLHRDAPRKIAEVWRAGISKIQFPLLNIDAEGRPTDGVFPNFRRAVEPSRIRAELLRTGLYRCSPTSGNAFARPFLERLFPLPEGVSKGADSFLNVAAPLYGDVVTLLEPLASYRTHGLNSWAQQVLDAKKFAGYIREDVQRTRYLAALGEELGLAIPKRPLDSLPLHLEFRMASRKLAPREHPIAESVGRIWRLAVAATLRSVDSSPTERLVLLTWFTAVALAPRRLAEPLVSIRFVPSLRPGLLRWVLRRLGVLGGQPVPTPFEGPQVTPAR